MEQVNSPDAAREIASFRERLKAFRSRGTALTVDGTVASSQVRLTTSDQASHFAEPDTREAPDTTWSDTQWTDTVFDSGNR